MRIKVKVAIPVNAMGVRKTINDECRKSAITNLEGFGGYEPTNDEFYKIAVTDCVEREKLSGIVEKYNEYFSSIAPPFKFKVARYRDKYYIACRVASEAEYVQVCRILANFSDYSDMRMIHNYSKPGVYLFNTKRVSDGAHGVYAVSLEKEREEIAAVINAYATSKD